MQIREIPDWNYCNETKFKILNEATKLFALKGFAAVTMRDIANAVGIKMCSIYYYYDSKEALFHDIMSRFENGYRHYFTWLKNENKKVRSLEEFMDNMFNKEFTEMLDPIGCCGISLVLKEQHNNPSARKHFFDLFLDHSIKNLKENFDRLIEKGMIPSSDTKSLATIFINNVLILNDIRLHEYFGTNSPTVNCAEIYLDLKNFITCVLRQGINKSIL